MVIYISPRPGGVNSNGSNITVRVENKEDSNPDASVFYSSI